jgi:two-component system response regulator (stage 0 sporulation protein A)
MTSILLVDTNLELCDVLKQYLGMQKGFEVVGVVHDGLDAVRAVRNLKPDLVIMDLGLPLLDGLGVLDELRGELPQVLVITAFTNDEIIQMALQKGAVYCLVKPFYLSVLEKTIREICVCQQEVVLDSSLAGVYLDQDLILSHIEAFLHDTGIKSNLKGYSYLKEALFLLTVNQSILVEGLTKSLYPKLAKNFNTSAESVEAAIRGAIQSSWKTNKENLLGVFPHLKNYPAPPTNAQFINLGKNELIRRMNQV